MDAHLLRGQRWMGSSHARGEQAPVHTNTTHRLGHLKALARRPVGDACMHVCTCGCVVPPLLVRTPLASHPSIESAPPAPSRPTHQATTHPSASLSACCPGAYARRRKFIAAILVPPALAWLAGGWEERAPLVGQPCSWRGCVSESPVCVCYVWGCSIGMRVKGQIELHSIARQDAATIPLPAVVPASIDWG